MLLQLEMCISLNKIILGAQHILSVCADKMSHANKHIEPYATHSKGWI
jgi:hypothetical protein